MLLVRGTSRTSFRHTLAFFRSPLTTFRSPVANSHSPLAARAFTTSSPGRSYALFDVVDDDEDDKNNPPNNLLRVPTASKMPSPGLMFIASHVLDPSKTSDEQYNRFYNEGHLPDVLKYGVSKLALRYKNVNAESKDRPYIALYPLDDAAFLQSPELGKLVEDTKISKVFGGSNVYEHVHFELRGYEKVQTFEGYCHAEKSGDERGRTVVCVAMEPAEGGDEDFEQWYRKQHLDMLAMCRGYRRTTRYKKLDGSKPRYLALHEYACKPDELPVEQTKQVVATEWSQKILKECEVFDRDVFELVQAQGETALKL